MIVHVYLIRKENITLLTIQQSGPVDSIRVCVAAKEKLW